MKTTLNDNTLTLYLEGRIDSTNASRLDQEMTAVVEANPGADLVIDAENLEYISSAGLRVLMNLWKMTNKQSIIQGVSPKIYDALDMTGFTDIFDVRKALRKRHI